MDLIINGSAVMRSSLGARRYFQGVMRHLDWPGQVAMTPARGSAALDRFREIWLRGRRDAIFWSPCHRGPLFAHNHVVTVLDCINIQYTYQGDWRLPLLRANFALLLANAAAVATISHATRDAVLDLFRINPRKVVAIPGPTDFREEIAPPAMPGAAGPGFILMITNSLPHKNTLRAAQALVASSAASRGMLLRVVGTLDPQGIATCAAAGLTVEQHRGVADDILHAWLAAAQFTFLPSLQEGLNLPAGEALALGGNILCSDIPVHREFYQSAVLFCDPLDVGAMSRAIDEALARPGRWRLPMPSNLRGFSDIAGDYKALFGRVADGEFSAMMRT